MINCLTYSIHVLSSRKSFVYTNFFVIQDFVDIQNIGVFAAEMIKKRRFWTKYISGNAIYTRYDGEEVVSMKYLHGTLDNVTFDIFGMNYPEYIIKIMSTYEFLITKVGNKKV